MNNKDLCLYKEMDDVELVDTVDIEIDKMKNYLESENMNEYWKIAMEVNNMIIEIKNRSIKMDEGELIRKILKK
ncbi:MAG TPA: hypothetical protein VK071_09495 [Tissierellales bacterium]|nr:hypothetical protein [Tissierellales bacterium]